MTAIFKETLRRARMRLDRELTALAVADLPVDLTAATIRHRCNVQLTHDPNAHLGRTERTASGSYLITIRGRRNPFRDPLLRFTLAHEVGHCVIDHAQPVLPTSTSEYWQLEDVCNEFATRLLLPAEQMSRRIPTVDSANAKTGAALLHACDALATTARTSREVAGRRIADVHTQQGRPVVLAAVSYGTTRRQGRASEVIKIDWSGGDNRQFGRGSHITDTHAWWPVLADALCSDALQPPRREPVTRSTVTVRRLSPSQWGIAAVPEPVSATRLPALATR